MFGFLGSQRTTPTLSPDLSGLPSLHWEEQLEVVDSSGFHGNHGTHGHVPSHPEAVRNSGHIPNLVFFSEQCLYNLE